jgi:cephalosporin-C deacetylase
MTTEPQVVNAPDPPEDFVEFWQDAVAEAMAAPLHYRRSGSNDYLRSGFKVEKIEFLGMGEAERFGWIACPTGAHRERAFLWVPPYGRWSMLPNDYGTREGFVSMSFNFFGESAFHEEAYTPLRGYFADGAASPQTWVFRRMFQDCVVALRVLEAQPEVDEGRMAAMGLSQGGGLAVWLGAWSDKVKAVCADYPFLSAMEWVLASRVQRYPLKELVDFMDTMPLGREVVMHTLSYYDTVTQAAHCRVPTLVSLGLKDPAVRPEQARAVYEALPGEKRLVEYDWGHDWHPDMVATNLEFLLSVLG